jgi:pimeloyl-ACP methyl ester carboxylesterase
MAMQWTEGREGIFFMRESGPRGAARTILMLHGLGDSGESFAPLAEHPALSDFRLAAPDIPGYGRAPRAQESVSLKAVADSLAVWIASRAARSVTVIGHSMGGALAQLLAERYPERISAVIDVEGNISREDCTISGRVAAQSLEEFVSAGFGELTASLERLAAGDPVMTAYCESVKGCDPASLHLHAAELVALSEAEDLADRLAALPCPAIYVAGSPGGVGPRTLDQLRRAGVVTKVLSPSGHCPHLEHTDHFVKEVLSLPAIAP